MRKTNVVIGIFIILLEITFLGNADALDMALPQSADISVNNIYIDDPESSVKVLGKQIDLIEPDNDFPQVNVYNKDKTQILTLIFHYGGIRNSFSEFRIKLAKSNSNLPSKHLQNIENFVTGKKISLGMTKNELVNILGNKYSETTKEAGILIEYEIDDYDKSDFLKKYNMPHYYGRYHFKDNKLIEILFGFTYP